MAHHIQPKPPLAEGTPPGFYAEAVPPTTAEAEENPLGYTMDPLTEKVPDTSESGMTYPVPDEHTIKPPSVVVSESSAATPLPTDAPSKSPETQPRPPEPDMGPEVVLDYVEQEDPDAPPGTQPDSTRTKPELNQVQAAIELDDEPLATRITRSGPDSPLKVRMHPSLVPKGAGYHQPNEVMPTAEKPDVQTLTNQEAADTQPTFGFWVNVREERHSPPGGSDADEANVYESPGWDLHGMTDHPEGDQAWEVVVTGEPVPRDNRNKMADTISDIAEDASRTTGRDADAARANQYQKDFTPSASRGTVLQRFIRVGATTREGVIAAARRFRGSVLPQDPVTDWYLETENGEVKVYTSQQEAHQAVKTHAAEEASRPGLDARFNSFVGANRFRDLIKLPNNRELFGLPAVQRPKFAVNQVFTERDVKIPFGHITQNGRRLGRMFLTEAGMMRHNLVVGASGSGKTELIRRMIAETKLRNPDVQVIVVDFKKEDNYAADLAKVMNQMGITGDAAAINVVKPKSDKPLGNINLLKITGEATPVDQVQFASDALVASVVELSARYVLAKHISAALELSYEKAGWDLTTNKSRYPHGVPSTPDMDSVLESISEVLSSAGFKADTQRDLEGWTRTQIENTMRGYAGKLFQNGAGYDIDWDKLRQNKGVTIFEFKHMSGVSRQVALGALMRQITGRLEQERQAERNEPGYNPEKPKIMLVMDETGGVLSPGSEEAGYAEYWRELGGSMTIAQQNINDLDESILSNAGSVFAMKQVTAETLQRLSERMGGVSLQKLQILNSVTAGNGLFFSETTPNGPVEFNFDKNPTSTDKPIDIRGVEDIVSWDYDCELYTDEVKMEARSRLRNTVLGNYLQAAATCAVQAVLAEEPLPDLQPEMIERLAGLKDFEAQVRDKMITDAAAKAIIDIPEARYAAALEVLIPYLRDDILAQVKPGMERNPTPRPDLALNTGRYGFPITHVKEILTAERVLVDDNFKQVLVRVGGLSAQEQRDSLYSMERAAFKAASMILFEATKQFKMGQMQDIKTYEAELRACMHRLVGGADAQQFTELVDSLATQVASSFRTKSTPGGQEGTAAPSADTINFIEAMITNAVRDRPAYGLPAFRKLVEDKIDKAENADAPDLQQFAHLYPNATLPSHMKVVQRGDQMVKVPVKAKEILNELEKMRKEYIENSLYAPVEADVFFAPNGMDAIIGRILREDQMHGRVYKELQAKLHDGNQPSLGIVDLIATDDPLRVDWERIITEQVLYGGMGHRLHRQTVYRLRVGYAAHIKNMRQMAEDRRAHVEDKIAKAAARQAQAGNK